MEEGVGEASTNALRQDCQLAVWSRVAEVVKKTGQGSDDESQVHVKFKVIFKYCDFVLKLVGSHWRIFSRAGR